MSSEGVYRIRLRAQMEERIRREAERRRQERFRREADELMGQCADELATLGTPAEQVLARESLLAVRSALDSASALRGAEPEEARDTALHALGIIQRVRQQARQAAAAWSAERAEATESVARLSKAVEQAQQDTSFAGHEKAALASSLSALADARRALEWEDFRTALQCSQRGRAALSEAEEKHAATEAREAKRRYIVSALLQTLKEMGFVQASTKLLVPEQDGGKVVLTGTLPSGRSARLEVAVTGDVGFDFSGYVGRECGKDLGAIRARLEEHFGAGVEVVQHRWKGPDLLSKGACHLPWQQALGRT